MDVAPADHKHVVLTGRGWGKAMAMAGEAMGRWEVAEHVCSVHLVPAVRGSAATTAAAMAAEGASAAKVWIRGGVCQAQLVCQRKEWEVKGGGPPLVPEGHILALTWRRRTEEEDGGMEAPGQGVATPAAEEEGDLGLWCHLHPQQLLPQQGEAVAPKSQLRLQQWAKREAASAPHHGGEAGGGEPGDAGAVLATPGVGAASLVGVGVPRGGGLPPTPGEAGGTGA